MPGGFLQEPTYLDNPSREGAQGRVLPTLRARMLVSSHR